MTQTRTRLEELERGYIE